MIIIRLVNRLYFQSRIDTIYYNGYKGIYTITVLELAPIIIMIFFFFNYLFNACFSILKSIFNFA